jgi:hypothetical protein
MIVLMIAHAGIPMIGKITKRTTNSRNRARITRKWYPSARYQPGYPVFARLSAVLAAVAQALFWRR